MVKKTIVWMLVLISLAALLLRFGDKIAETFLGIKQESGISVLSDPSEAAVFLDDKEVGKTPYEDKTLEVRGYTVKIQKAGAVWQGKVTLTPGAVTIINRDLAQNQASSAGEILTLDRGKGLTIVSNPTAADIEVDGRVLGKTPLTADVSTGARTILISHSNYVKRSIQANLPADFNLTVAVDLALSEADLTTIVTPAITQTPQVPPQVTVKSTPTGFLRVRDKPNLNGKEVAQVKPGDILTLLEELEGWDKIRLSSGVEGFVSVSYVEKKNP